MKRLLLWVVVAGGVAGAQSPENVAGGPVKTRKAPDVLRLVEAMPVVLQVPSLRAEVVDKINAASRRLDAKVKFAAEPCVKREGMSKLWMRRVFVTMRGPRYLSIYSVDQSYCNERPEATFLPLVYDLNTGGTVNWLKLLPPGATSGVDNAPDGNKVGAVIWPVLTDMARVEATKACADVFEAGNQVPFVLWLDAKSGTIKAQPSDLPHSLIQCTDKPVSISVAQARAMGGFNQEMIDALEAAHKMQH